MIDIKKTYKNYVDGKYVRSESGKTYTKELKKIGRASCRERV